MAASVWKGHITFGLITIPVRLLRAARSERVPLRELYRTNEPEPVEQDVPPAKGPIRIDQRRNAAPEPAAPEPVYEPIRHVAMGRNSDEPAPAGAITKGYEFERGRYVTLAPEELRSIAPQTSRDMEIVEFVKLADVDPVYFEASYYVKPEEAGRKPYALLYAAMREAGYAGVGQFAMHRRDRVAILRPGPVGLMAHAMYFTAEVRSDEEVRADLSLVSEKEVALAKSLVGALAGPFEPSKYRDKYRDRLEALIAAKVEGRETATISEAAPVKETVDIMEALRKSLEAIKKPAAKAEPPVKRAARKTGRTSA
ncbi:MAG TPA: Ku protein [Bryobacteraceae bacterium]|jgi:DNA end-binding protein Ku